MKTWVKYALGTVLAGALAASLLVLPWSRWTLRLVEWIREAGAVGVAFYVVAYVVATLLLLPGSVLTAGAGFAYGPVLGTLLVSPASVLAATLSFLLGRSAARDWVSRRIATDPRFGAIDRAIGESGFRIVLLLRLSPIVPFNLLNYALGLTRVRLRDYVLASFLGMLPGTVLYVYLGSVVKNASELLAGRAVTGPWGQALYWGGLVATIAAAVLISRTARRALHRTLDRPAPSLPPGAREARP